MKVADLVDPIQPRLNHVGMLFQKSPLWVNSSNIILEAKEGKFMLSVLTCLYIWHLDC